MCSSRNGLACLQVVQGDSSGYTFRRAGLCPEKASGAGRGQEAGGAASARLCWTSAPGRLKPAGHAPPTAPLRSCNCSRGDAPDRCRNLWQKPSAPSGAQWRSSSRIRQTGPAGRGRPLQAPCLLSNKLSPLSSILLLLTQLLETQAEEASFPPRTVTRL